MTLKDFVLDLQGGNVDADFDALLSGILKLVTMSLEPVLPKVDSHADHTHLVTPVFCENAVNTRKYRASKKVPS